MSRENKKNELYGVIGLGRFGFPLAKALASAGKEVLVIDQIESKVAEASAFTENAFIVGELTKENLQDVGVQNCDTVIICIAEKIDVSVMTTLVVLKLGVKRVIAKAISEEHACVLETLGAEVVQPEHDMGVRVAKRLIMPHVLEYISLSEEIEISEIKLDDKFANISILDIDIRKKYGLNIIAIKHEGKINIEITPNTIIMPGDSITVIGKKNNITAFERSLN